MALTRTRISRKLAAVVVGLALMLGVLFGSHPAAQEQASVDTNTNMVVADGGGVTPPPGQG